MNDDLKPVLSPFREDNWHVNYVIASWSGPRRNIVYQPHTKDPAFYIREHLESLRVLRHNLSQITLVVPQNKKEPPAFTEFVSIVEKAGKINGTPLVVYRRKNIGLSYGSWSDVFGHYRSTFSHYIFTEDDYKFSQDNFDSILKSYMTEKTAYVAGLVRPMYNFPLHAAVAIGLCKSEALENVWVKYGCLPHASDSNYHSAEQIGQIGMSQAMIRQGWKLRDVTDKYSVHFRHVNNVIEKFGRGTVLIEPI